MIKKVKLGEVADLSIGFVGTVTTQYENGGIPFLRTLNVKPYKIIDNDLKRITKEFHESQKKSKLMEGDVAMVHTGVPGICCVIPEEYNNSNCIDMIVIKPHKDKINAHYLAAYMNTVGYKHIEKQQVGCIQKHFNLKDAEELEIFLPDIETQNKIGEMVNNINNKIENNNAINAELESMAKTIYDYWFLQFEFPNEEGKPYKSSGGKMVWNEELKREIPEGWKVSKIGNTDIYVSDYTANGSFAGLADNVKYNEGEKYALLIRPVDFNTNFEKEDSFIYVNKHGYEYLSKSKLFGDEIIICNVGAVGAVYRCPRLDIPMTLGPNGIVVNNKKYNHYLSCHFKSEIGQQQLLSISSGSIQMKFNKTNFRDISIVFPTDDILNKFNSLYGEIYNKQQTIWKENKELTSLRDFLLPMLMNGQVGFKINNRKE